MKVSDYIAKFISKHSSHIFVGQGGNIIHLLDSCSKIKNLKIIPSQNEQCAAIAADAYSRINSDKIGFTAVTSGPGMLNLMQGIACSYYDSIPTFHFSGAVVTSQLRKNKKIRQVGFQEMEVVDLVKPITNYAVLLKNKNMIRYELEKMLYFSKNGRPGPVLMDLPDDIQRSNIDLKKLKKFKIPRKSQKKPVNVKNKFLNLLKKSNRPLVIYGNGIKNSNTEVNLKKFIKSFNLPYIPTWACLDIDIEKKNYNAGSFGVAATRFGNFAVQNSDFLIVLGSRLPTQVTGSDFKKFAPRAKKMVVDVDKSELSKTQGVKIDFKVNMDLRDFFKLFKKNIKNKKIYNEWVANFSKWKSQYPICKQSYYTEKKYVNPYVFMEFLSMSTTKGDILIPDASANLIWAMQSFQPKGQKIFTALNHSPMGYSMPATIGAYCANQKNRIICTIGDGSMQMNIQELATIAHFNIPAKIFVFNNSGYGLIKQTQETWLGNRYVGVDKKSGLAMPNLLKITEAYGIETCIIKNNKDVKKKIRYVLSRKKPIYCEVMISKNQRVNPKLEFGRPIHDLSPLLTQNELKKNILC